MEDVIYTSVNKSALTESEKAKEWLKKAIESCFQEDNGEMEKITTPVYEEYKTDATNVDLDWDRSLTQLEFENKWKDKYDIKYAGVGNGFLISGQDWGKIEVLKCDLLEETENSYIFKTIIRDVEYKIDYERDIEVIRSGNSFLINDIKEYN